MVLRLFEFFQAGSALRVLEALASAGLAVFLTLLDPRIPGQKTGRLQAASELLIEIAKCAAESETQCPRLTTEPTTSNLGVHIELVRGFRQLQGLLDDHLEGIAREVVLEGTSVDQDLTLARSQENAGYRSLPLARSVVLNLSGSCQRFLALGLTLHSGAGFARWRSRRFAVSQRLRLLRLMRMLGAGIDFQLSELRPAEPILGEHTSHRCFDESFRMPSSHLARGKLPNPPRITRVPVVLFVLFFRTGESHLVSVDHDDMVSRIEERSVDGFFFAGQNARDAARQASENLSLGVHDEPLVFNLGFLGERCLHLTSAGRAKRVNVDEP